MNYVLFYRLEHAGDEFSVVCATEDMAVDMAEIVDQHGAQCGCCASCIKDPSGRKVPGFDGAQRL